MTKENKKIVDKLTELCIPILSEFREELKVKHDTFKIEIGKGEIGELTPYQGYHIYLECYRDGYIPDEPNCIALEISLKHLNTDKPIIDSFGISWGGDGIPPDIDGLDLLPEEIIWTKKMFEKINIQLPKLKHNLNDCLKAWQNDYPK
ncbi:hypothetical protein [uncultured Tenacibaculum sp.]|uniref:hypothetical protein n=1 Tax=uncultured Tenacibaculum sp. TaxID=174713 RepID=UPI002620CBCC|nr:hypothetical protein [uncultured Tenacibaculum sp.]